MIPARCLAVLLLLAAGALPAQAGLYEDAKTAIRTEVTPQYDASGVSVRGGMSLKTGERSHSATVFRAQAQSGGSCSAFDFRGSMKEAFEEFPAMLEALVHEIVGQLPLLAACYASPTICDLFKHYQALMNALIQAKYGQCQAIQHAAMYAGKRLAGGEESNCLQVMQARGFSLQKALSICAEPTFVRRVDGSVGTEKNLVADTLAWAGATSETQALASALLGEVNVRAGNGGLRTQNDLRQRVFLARYNAHRLEAEMGLRTAVVEYRDTGTVSVLTIEAVSVPGQPLPVLAFEALHALSQDPGRYEALIGKLSTGLALTRLTWDCHDLEEQIQTAIDNNQELTAEEYAQIQRRVATLRSQLARFHEKTVAIEKLQPTLELLFEQYAAQQGQAVQSVLTAPPAQVVPLSPYGRQTPLGYTR